MKDKEGNEWSRRLDEIERIGPETAKQRGRVIAQKDDSMTGAKDWDIKAGTAEEFREMKDGELETLHDGVWRVTDKNDFQYIIADPNSRHYAKACKTYISDYEGDHADHVAAKATTDKSGVTLLAKINGRINSAHGPIEGGVEPSTPGGVNTNATARELDKLQGHAPSASARKNTLNAAEFHEQKTIDGYAGRLTHSELGRIADKTNLDGKNRRWDDRDAAGLSAAKQQSPKKK